MNTHDEAPDKRFWTTYDFLMFEREARAMRRAHLGAMFRRLAKRVAARVRAELAQAGAQPPRRDATRSAGSL